MKTLFYLLLLIGAFIFLYQVREPELHKYNNHICAVEGFQADCVTPLPSGDNK